MDFPSFRAQFPVLAERAYLNAGTCGPLPQAARDAHVATLDRMVGGEQVGPTLNVGRGVGASVFEVLRVLAEVSGLDTTPEVVGRRPGDPARVVAAVDRIARDVHWRARADLPAILESAWAAWQARPPAL